MGKENDVEGKRKRRNERLCGREPRIEMYILLHTYLHVHGCLIIYLGSNSSIAVFDIGKGLFASEPASVIVP